MKPSLDSGAPPIPAASTPRLSQATRDRLVAMVVALPLFLQNVDSSVMTTALPAMARSLQVDTLRLNLAVTAYLISLAVFLPASGWLADRFGARRVFLGAIAVFSAASALCGIAQSLGVLVVCRVLQGLGGAMMVPVGRLILLRSIPATAIVSAMVWFTVPPAFGRMIGPLVGGMVVTWVSWRWIFLINVPLGALAIALALGTLDDDEAPEHAGRSFDYIGFVLLGIGLASLLASLETATSHVLSGAVSAALGLGGAACLAVYVFHSRRAAAPLLELSVFRFQTFFAATVGGLPLRLAIGAVPFLLPLLLQLGFGLSPLQSGLLTMGTAIGSLATRTILTRAIRRFGFRRLLIGATVLSSLSYVGYANLHASTPHAVVFLACLASGLLMSLAMVALQTLAFTEVPKPLMGHATALSTIAQQISFSLGVVMAVELLRVALWLRGDASGHLAAADFPLAFYAIAVVVPLAIVILRRLPADVGEELR
jgi:EmrB/QacA subfamily drug resistance transporter